MKHHFTRNPFLYATATSDPIISVAPSFPDIPNAMYSFSFFKLAASSMVMEGANTLQAIRRFEWSISQFGMVVSRADSNISTRAGGTFKSSGMITCPRLKFLLVSYIENHLISKMVRFPGSFNRTSCRPTLEFGLNWCILFNENE